MHAVGWGFSLENGRLDALSQNINVDSVCVENNGFWAFRESIIIHSTRASLSWIIVLSRNDQNSCFQHRPNQRILSIYDYCERSERRRKKDSVKINGLPPTHWSPVRTVCTFANLKFFTHVW